MAAALCKGKSVGGIREGQRAPVIWEVPGATRLTKQEEKKNKRYCTCCNAIESLCPRDEFFLFCVCASCLPLEWEASLLVDTL